MYTVEFSKKAGEQFSKLPSDVKIRMFQVFDRIKIRPHHFVKRLVGTNYFRLRVGDYRVILDIQNDKLIIFVIEVGHRRNIYK